MEEKDLLEYENIGKKIKKDEELEGYYIDGFSGKGIQVLTKKKK